MPIPDPKRWAEIKSLFAELLDVPAVTRAERLKRLESTDGELARQVARLLDAESRAGGPQPATAVIRAAVEQAARSGAEAVVGAASAASHPEFIGEYKILQVLGEGGMGVVYLAQQRSPQRLVALKALRGVLGGAIVRRFKREAELLGRLQHPNIALIHEAGVSTIDAAAGGAGREAPFFAMEYVRGDPITDFASNHHLGARERVQLIAKVCDAVDHAHRRGVIHRDLKPANILVDDRGEPKVLDFGIARPSAAEGAATLQTMTGEVIGTLPYMSPEQVSGDPDAVDGRTDVYSLGVVLFELLAGRRPIDLSDRAIPEAVRRVTEDEPTKLGTLDRALRGDLETITAKCLEKERDRRYRSAAELGDDLRRFLEHRPIEARPPSAYYQVTRFARRHRTLVAVVSLAFVLVTAVAIVAVVYAVESRAAQKRAEQARDDALVENARSGQSFAFLEDLLTAVDPVRSAGREVTAKDLLDHAAKRLDNPDETSQVVGLLGRLIGLTYQRLGYLDNAAKVLARSVEINRHPDKFAVQGNRALIESLCTYGDLLREQGRFEEAQSALQEAVELIRASPKDDPRIGDLDTALAATLTNLGLVAMERGDFAASERYSREAVLLENVLKARRVPRATARATAMVNLGSAQYSQGHLQEAEQTFREAAEAQALASGPDAPLTLTARNNHSVALRSLGHYEEALAIMRDILAHREALLPRDHPESVNSRSNIGHLLLSMGHVREADAMIRDALRGRAASLGESHADTARSRNLLAMALDEQGSLAQAEAEARRALRDHLAVMKPTHTRCIEDMIVLARIERHAGRRDEALATAREALARADEGIGPAHPMTLAARAERAACQVELGRAREQIDELREIVGARSRYLGAEHPDTARSVLELAEAQWLAGERVDAAASGAKAASLLRASSPGLTWEIAMAELLAGGNGGADPAELARRAAESRRAALAELGEQAPFLARLARLSGPGSAQVPTPGAAIAGSAAP